MSRRKSQRSYTLILAGILLGPAGQATNYKGSVRALDGSQNVLFQFKRTFSAQADKEFGIGEYKDPNGTIAVSEETILKGDKVFSHAVEQLQLKESGLMTVEGNKLKFSYKKDGKEKTATEDLPDNLVVSASLVPFIKSHWKELVEGKTVKMRYAALDRRETVGFELFKVEGEKAKATQTVIKMKPSSFIIAALVNPLFIYMNTQTQNLEEIRGRTAPKAKINGSWKDLDAHTIYEVVP